MSTLTQADTSAGGEVVTISFRSPKEFKRDLDLEIAHQQTSLQEFCTRVLSEAVKKAEESRRKKAGR